MVVAKICFSSKKRCRMLVLSLERKWRPGLLYTGIRRVRDFRRATPIWLRLSFVIFDSSMTRHLLETSLCCGTTVHNLKKRVYASATVFVSAILKFC